MTANELALVACKELCFALCELEAGNLTTSLTHTRNAAAALEPLVRLAAGVQPPPTGEHNHAKPTPTTPN